VIRHLCSTT